MRGGRIVIKTLAPCPSLVAGRATERDQQDWTPEQRVIRSCMHCHTVYLDAGRAYVCEHHHEGLF
jgi:hypothetical protein